MKPNAWLVKLWVKSKTFNYFYFWIIINHYFIQITSRDDPFLDLSIDIEQNSSVTSCLRQFSASEMLVHQDKFFCDVCCGLQEAEKRYVHYNILDFLFIIKCNN